MKQSSYKIYSSTKDAWEAMYQAIERAQRSIFWELYIFVDDTAGKPFFDLLMKKAKEGVEVRVIVDSLGSFWLSKERVSALKNSGVDILFFHERKYKYRGFWRRLWKRTHRKVLVIDEEIGFVGGVNIRSDMQDWYDFMVEFDGDTVFPLLRYFAKSYIISGGERKKVRRLLYMRGVPTFMQTVRAVFDEPSESGVSNAKREYIKALRKAKKSVIVFSPHYVPDAQFLRALWLARKRGVRVDILLPFSPDVRFLSYVAYGYFSLMNSFGVKVHLTKNMLHGKGFVVDDSWAMVGSSNIDETSFRDNYEANVTIHDRQIVSDIKKVLLKWLQDSDEITKYGKKGGIWHRMKVWLAVRLYRMWYR